jgi:predicted AAA+ superfamily ATPase
MEHGRFANGTLHGPHTEHVQLVPVSGTHYYLPRRAASAVAEADPTGFVAFSDLMVIDEIRHESDVSRADYADRITRGGLPEAVARTDTRRRGRFLAAGSLESELRISKPTIARYLRLLEEVFLIKRIPGWSRNLGSRVTNAAKLVFVDSGIAARLLAIDPHALRRPGAPFGPLLEVGIVLYTGTATLPFGPKLRAVPVSALWKL